MRIHQGPLVDDMSGTVGPMSVCSRHGRLYFRPLIRRHYPGTQAQLDCQARLAHIQFLRDDLATWDWIADFPGAWAWQAHHLDSTPYHQWLKLNLKAENQGVPIVATPTTPWTAAQGGPIHQVRDLTFTHLPSFWVRVTWTSTNTVGHTLCFFFRVSTFPDWLHPVGARPSEAAETHDIRNYYLQFAYQVYAIPFRDADLRCGPSTQIEA